MARPLKAGLNYFPVDTDIDQDDKIALIEAKYGILGFGVIIKLFKKIYGSNGYYYDWNEQTQLLFAKSIGVDFNKIVEIIDDAIKWDLFNKRLWKTYRILTSKRIQKTYLEATGRRKEVEIIKEYMINGVNEYKNKDNVNIYSKKDDISTQRKGKEKKVKESKIKYSDFVFLIEEEHKKLIEKLGEDKTKIMIERLNGYIGQIGVKKANKKYVSHYHTILNWVRMENGKKSKEDWRDF